MLLYNNITIHTIICTLCQIKFNERDVHLWVLSKYIILSCLTKGSGLFLFEKLPSTSFFFMVYDLKFHSYFIEIYLYEINSYKMHFFFLFNGKKVHLNDSPLSFLFALYIYKVWPISHWDYFKKICIFKY